MEFFLWFIGIVVVGTILFQILVAKGQKELRTGAQNWMDGLGITQYRIAFDPGDALGVDYEGRRLAVTVDGVNHLIPFDKLISAEISEDGVTTNKTNRGSQAIGAAIGAVAFGGVGAVIGGLSGSSTSKEKVGNASINIITSLPDAPYLQVKVFRSQPTDKNGFVYQTLTKDMLPWYGRLKAIIESQ